MTSNENKFYQSKVYDSRGALKGNLPQRVFYTLRARAFSKIINSLHLKNKKILDVGCGTGLLFDFFGKENFITGIEISRKAVSEARGYAKSKGLKARVIISNIARIDKLGFKKKQFDLIVLADVVEHINVTREFLSSIIKILKDDGYVLVSVPNKNYINPFAMPAVFEFLRKLFSVIVEELKHEPFHKHYTAKELQKEMFPLKLVKIKKASLGAELICLFKK